MGQYVLLSPNANKKLRAILQGTFLHRLFRFSSLEQLTSLIRSFHTDNAVYIRFSHIAKFQPKFYIGSTSSTVLDREHTRFRKFVQVQQNKFVLAEVALRFWNRFDNFWMWSIFPLFTDNPNFWALEQALIQLWQPRLNTPFIYQFFKCRKGLIVQRPFSSTRQLGTFSLWRKLRWASTPQRIRKTFYSKRFHDRSALWEVIQHLGSNSLKRFQMEKRIRSHEFGLHGCYFVRKLASLDIVPYMVPRSSPDASSAYCSDATSHSDLSVSILCSGFHQEPVGQRQPMQSQGLCHPLGRWGNPSVYLLHFTAISDLVNTAIHPPSPRWRFLDTLHPIFDFNCHRIATE